MSRCGYPYCEIEDCRYPSCDFPEDDDASGDGA